MVQMQKIGGDDHSSPPNGNVENLKTELGNLTRTVKNLASEQMGSTAKDVQDQAARKMNDIETAIRKNPTQAAVMAAGIGFLVGLVLTR